MNVGSIIRSRELHFFLAGCLFGVILIIFRNEPGLDFFFAPAFLALPVAFVLGGLMFGAFGQYYFKDDFEAWIYFAMAILTVLIYGFIFFYVYRIAKFITKKYRGK